ncbi:CU044_2847 family protein [Gloeothece verrucosa]|uniref:Trypsin-co-occurring domain-containing protein n=1 Tax=Gloeothece verrucosa (strain PCC 7822) TaxID=497965 RepID=E0UNC6_GLOV7|nr:CU044_2847 family protein [Gloeothece verrucosa]ADN18456.1 conserved hypothetical protein [Gloeothece verrucosa PCC 7822]
MVQLTPIQLDDDTVVYIEADDNVDVTPVVEQEQEEEELTRDSLGKGKGLGGKTAIAGSMKAIEHTIKAYTTYSLNAFKGIAAGSIDKVTLEFGIKVAGKAGIPYLTEGSADSHLKITVECSFPKKDTQP